MSIRAHQRPALTQAQREAVAAVVQRRAWLKRQMAGARRAHALYLADLRAQLAALPTLQTLADQYGICAQQIGVVGRGRQYKYEHILDEREQVRA